MSKRGIKVIDLFCGIGGLSYGFVQEDFNVVAGYDIDATCKFAYEANNQATFNATDITTISINEILKYYGKSVKILIGCAPCQPFSSYSYKMKKKDENKVNLLYTFLEITKQINPLIISMENVPQLEKFDNGKIFQDFYDGLISMGYFIHYEVVFCPDYGIPQKRRRLILLASKLGPLKLIPKTHTKENYTTVADAIKDLPPIAAGETYEKDPLHKARELSILNIERIKASRPGGSWREWPDNLVLNCFKKDSGRSYGSVYGRMKWDEPSPTMTTQCTGLGNGRFGHPEQDRAISLREAARLQTFPDNYLFYNNRENFNPSIICRQIGNAVPPKLGQIIAKSIKQHLIEYSLWQRKKDL